jgi:hypothetical protein
MLREAEMMLKEEREAIALVIDALKRMRVEPDPDWPDEL